MTTKYVVKIRNSDGLEIGQMPNNKWGVLVMEDSSFEQGDTIEILRPYQDEESVNIRPSDKEEKIKLEKWQLQK